MLDRARNSVESPENRAMTALTFVESYRKGWEVFHVHITTVDGAEDCAIFHCAEVDVRRYMGRQLHRGLRYGEHAKMQIPMLVNVIETNESHKLDIPSWTWLQSLNDCRSAFANSFDLRLALSMKCNGLHVDRKLIEPSRFLPVGLDQLPNEMVEGRSEVKKGIAQDGTHSRRDSWGDAPKTPDMLSSIVVELVDDRISFRIREGCQFVFKQLDVFVGSCEFCLWVDDGGHDDVCLPHDKGETGGQIKDAQRPRNSHSDKGRVPGEPQEGVQAQEDLAVRARGWPSPPAQAHLAMGLVHKYISPISYDT